MCSWLFFRHSSRLALTLRSWRRCLRRVSMLSPGWDVVGRRCEKSWVETPPGAVLLCPLAPLSCSCWHGPHWRWPLSSLVWHQSLSSRSRWRSRSAESNSMPSEVFSQVRVICPQTLGSRRWQDIAPCGRCHGPYFLPVMVSCLGCLRRIISPSL